MTIPFGERLASVFVERGRLCVGIDPHPYLLGEWGLPDTPGGLREFGRVAIEATVGSAGIVKPQVAFFERHGSAGFAVLEELVRDARAAGLLVIADAKRGDLGTSVEAYGSAWLAAGSALESDAMTLSPFQGVGSLDPVIALARSTGKGVFLLAATSNPESTEPQTAILAAGPHAGRTLSGGIVEEVSRGNASPMGSVGLVIGATVDLAAVGIDPAALATTPILAPGFGHQGVGVESLHRIFGPAAGNVIVSSSRALLSAGPAGIAAAVRAQVAELAAVDAA